MNPQLHLTGEYPKAILDHIVESLLLQQSFHAMILIAFLIFAAGYALYLYTRRARCA